MTIPLTSPIRMIVATGALALALGAAGCKSTAAPAVDDAALTTAVHTRLSGDSALSNEPIQSSVQNGIVTLNGSVSNEAARSLAASDASQIPGVKTVVNNLTVAAPAPAPAASTTPAPTPAPAPAPVPVAAAKKPAPKPVREKPAPIERPQMAQNTPAPEPAPAAPAPAPVPAAPPPPEFKTVTIPAGTTIPVRVTQTLDSATTQQGQSFSGTVATDVMADGLVAIRQGSAVTGRVTAVQEAAHYKGAALLTVELVSVNRHGDSIAISTKPYTVEGKGRGGNTAAKVGGGAAIGAIIGAIAGGGKGAAIGSAAGAGVGAGANTVTRGEQVKIPSESLVNFQLTNSLAVRVSTSSTLSTTGQGGSGRRPMSTPEGSSGDQPPQ